MALNTPTAQELAFELAADSSESELVIQEAFWDFAADASDEPAELRTA